MTWLAVRGYAAAAVQKKASAPSKQVFMKKMKESRSASASSQVGVNRVAPLTAALFNVDPQVKEAAVQARSNPQEQQRRELIEAAWRRHEANRKHAQAEWEAAYVQGKMEAMQELQKVSGRLYQMACRVDYSLPPVHRRMATLTPPHPEHFPVKQD